MTETNYDDETRIVELSGGQRVHAFHKSSQCAPDHCPVHNPSDHTLRGLPLFYDGLGCYMYRRSDDGTTFVDPDDYKMRTAGSVIITNSAVCLKCETEVSSCFRHDFVTCMCGNVSVDGGLHYLKRSVKDSSKFEDTSIVCTPDNLVIE